MPKDNSSKPIYTSFDAARDELKAAYYGDSLLASRSTDMIRATPSKKATAPKDRVNSPSKPKKFAHHVA